LKSVSIHEDEGVSGQHLVGSWHVNVRLLSKLIKNRTYYYT